MNYWKIQLLGKNYLPIYELLKNSTFGQKWPTYLLINKNSKFGKNYLPISELLKFNFGQILGEVQLWAKLVPGKYWEPVARSQYFGFQ